MVKTAHYFAMKSLLALLRGTTSNYSGDFYCLNCFNSYRTEKNPKNMKDYAMIMIIVMWKFLIKTIIY